ncbi:MAG: magnesium transporter [Thermoprotei archaeon]|nr:MAG: magnesium transporter [Thermoprotei archaeon]
MFITVLVRGRDRPGLLKDIASVITSSGGNILFGLSYSEEGRASSLFIVEYRDECKNVVEALRCVDGVEEVTLEASNKAYALYVEFLERYPAMTSELVRFLTPNDFLEVLIRLPQEKRSSLYILVPPDYLGQLLVHAPQEIIDEAARVAVPKRLAEAIAFLPPDDAADVLQSLPPQVRRTVFEYLPKEFREAVKPLLQYPPESAGGIMTTSVVVLRKDITVREAVEVLKKSRAEIRDVIYVVDEHNRLLGYIPVPDLFKEDRNASLESVVRRDFIAVDPMVDREEVAKIMIRHDLSRVPVVDSDGRFLGVVSLDDVVDALVAEYSEDILLLGGIAKLPRFRYLTARLSTLFYRRFMWLIVIYLIESVTASVIKSYEGLIARTAVLAAFIPLLLDTGGNIGSQSATLITRALALGEVTRRDILAVVAKEFSVALLLGGALSSVAFVLALLVTSLDLEVALTVALSLVIVVLVADLMGALLPLAATSFGIDPAVMSNPLITTVVDVIGVMFYFTVASLML